MRLREDQKFRLQADDFLEIDLRPALRGVHDGFSAGMLDGVGYEGVLADRNEWLDPDYEQDTASWPRGDALLNLGEAVLQIICERGAGVRRAQYFRQTLRRGEDGAHGVRIGGVGRNAQVFEGMNGIDAIQAFGDQDKIGMKRGDGFEAGINGAADFG